VNAPPNGTILHGDQCLVFFLGGVQVVQNGVNGCQGFSTNPQDPGFTNPLNPTIPPLKFTPGIGPFMQFKANQLAGPYTDTLGGGGWVRNADPMGFFVYKDPWSTPYGYFSSYKSRNGYNRYGTGANCDCPALLPATSPLIGASLPGGAYNDGTNYQNAESVQIISAGANGLFGPGGIWSAPNASAIGANGQDDLCNFHDKIMGAP
jgi:hypothetical protein